VLVHLSRSSERRADALAEAHSRYSNGRCQHSEIVAPGHDHAHWTMVGLF
jgi:hypothetical protein